MYFFFFLICQLLCLSVHLLDDWFAHWQGFSLTARALKELHTTV